MHCFKMKKLFYIIWSIIESIYIDLKSSYDSLAKPKEVLNILLWILIIELLTERYIYAYITLGVYVIVYIWKIIKEGRWRHKLRRSY